MAYKKRRFSRKFTRKSRYPRFNRKTRTIIKKRYMPKMPIFKGIGAGNPEAGIVRFVA